MSCCVCPPQPRLALSTVSSVLPCRGHALEIALAAACLPCPMEAFLELEQSIYPYFCPGIGVFIASTCCCDESCRNTLLKALPVGVHLGCAHVCMLTHTCTGVHSPTWDTIPRRSHAGQASQASDQGCHGSKRTASPLNLPQFWVLIPGQDSQVKASQALLPFRLPG